MFQQIQRERDGYTLSVRKDRPRPSDAVESTSGKDKYAPSDTTAPNFSCHVPNPDVVLERGLSELPSYIHSDDTTEHDAFFAQTCVEEVESAEHAAPQKPVLSMRGGEPLDEDVDPCSRLREYVDSERRLVGKTLCYARPTRRSWPLN